jgi:hypothetical protein
MAGRARGEIPGKGSGTMAMQVMEPQTGGGLVQEAFLVIQRNLELDGQLRALQLQRVALARELEEVALRERELLRRRGGLTTQSRRLISQLGPAR